MTDNLSPEDRSRCMSNIRSQGMKPERAVRSIVHRAGYRFRLHQRELPGKPDLVLPRHGAVIFVNGCFWHWHPNPACPIAGLPKSNLDYWQPKLARTRDRDREHEAALIDLGWRVLTVWECELRDLEGISQTILAFIEPARETERSVRLGGDQEVPRGTLKRPTGRVPQTAT